MPTKTRDTQSDTWTTTDALGRTLPAPAECGPPRPGKFVGLFYFLWLDKRHDSGLWDISKLLAANPSDPQYGPLHAFHWWGEPRLGYYRMDDAFVLRKHAQMLSDAGVDVIFLDVTNALTYDENFLALCRVYMDIRRSGRTTPQIAFLANSNSAATVQHLYDTFYARNLYPDLWFRWKGKPLLLTPPDGLSEPVKNFFTLRHSWAWTDPNGWFGDGRDKWPWVDHTPQTPGWHGDPKKPEQISVAVAEHPVANIGRSFQNGKQPPLNEKTRNAADVEKGLYFDEQWKRALAVDPELVFVTGWNEWIAQRFVGGKDGNPGFLGRSVREGETFFVDQFNQEFSRDIEPMRGGHGDNYYWQLVANIRRFKGVRPNPKASAPKTIRIAGGFDQWANVGPDFLDDVGDTLYRKHAGWANAHLYFNTTGRNDFDLMKVARDKTNLYFYVRTRAPITPSYGLTWMTLLLDTDNKRETGWEGYDFAVRHAMENGVVKSRLCRNVGGRWAWEPVAPVKMTCRGNEMHLALPLKSLRLPPGRSLRVDFKWADNVPESGDILDFLDKGDAAPNGRFNYRYEVRTP